MQHKNWQCQKCKCRDFAIQEVRATGGAFARIFDIQNRKFSAIICDNCTFTEFYKTKSSAIGNVLDFLTQ